MNKGGSGRSALRPRRKLKTWKSRTGRKERDGKGVPLHPSIFFTGSTRRKAAWTPKIETRGRKRKRRRVAALQKRRRFQIVSHVLRDDGGAAAGELLVDVPPVSRGLTAQRAAEPQGRSDSISSQAPETHRTAGGGAARNVRTRAVSQRLTATQGAAEPH